MRPETRKAMRYSLLDGSVLYVSWDEHDVHTVPRKFVHMMHGTVLDIGVHTITVNAAAVLFNRDCGLEEFGQVFDKGLQQLQRKST